MAVANVAVSVVASVIAVVAGRGVMAAVLR
jgi:hypothetical protein